MENKIEILERNIGKEVVLSASYNETDGKIIEVSEKVGLVAVKVSKNQIKYIEISKIYEITEQAE